MKSGVLCLDLGEKKARAFMAGGRPDPAGAGETDLAEAGSLEQRLEAALDRLAQEAAGSKGAREVVLLLPDHEFCLKTLVMPFSSPGKIRQVLSLELMTRLPGEGPYATDFKVAGPVFCSHAHLVFTASLTRETFDALARCFKQRKMTLKAVAPRNHTLGTACLAGGREAAACVVVNPGDQTALLMVARGDKTIYARAYKASGPGFEALASWVGLSLKGFSLKFGVSSPLKVHVISPGAESLGDRLAAGLAGAGWPEAAVVEDAGGGRLIRAGAMSRGMMNLGASGPGTGPLLRENRTGLGILAGLAAAVFIILTAGLWQKTTLLEERIRDGQAQGLAIFHQAFPDKTPGPYPHLVMKSLVTREMDTAGQGGPSVMALPGATAVLAELSACLPAETKTVLTRLNLSGDSLSFSGAAPNFNLVDQVKNRLGKSGLFHRVTIVSAQSDTKGTAVRFRFTLGL